MKAKRIRPCLCVICDCGEVFAATILQKDLPIDGEFLNDLVKYAKEGYKFECKDASEFRMNCTCKSKSE